MCKLVFVRGRIKNFYEPRAKPRTIYNNVKINEGAGVLTYLALVLHHING